MSYNTPGEYVFEPHTRELSFEACRFSGHSFDAAQPLRLTFDECHLQDVVLRMPEIESLTLSAASAERGPKIESFKVEGSRIGTLLTAQSAEKLTFVRGVISLWTARGFDCSELAVQETSVAALDWSGLQIQGGLWVAKGNHPRGNVQHSGFKNFGFHKLNLAGVRWNDCVFVNVDFSDCIGLQESNFPHCTFSKCQGVPWAEYEEEEDEYDEYEEDEYDEYEDDEYDEEEEEEEDDEDEEEEDDEDEEDEEQQQDTENDMTTNNNEQSPLATWSKEAAAASLEGAKDGAAVAAAEMITDAVIGTINNTYLSLINNSELGRSVLLLVTPWAIGALTFFLPEMIPGKPEVIRGICARAVRGTVTVRMAPLLLRMKKPLRQAFANIQSLDNDGQDDAGDESEVETPKPATRRRRKAEPASESAE